MSEEKDINKILGRTQEWDREAITRLHAEAAELRAQLTAGPDKVLRCAFCGFAYPDGTPTHKHESLAAHVRVCTEHPVGKELRALRADLASAKAEVERVRGRIENLLNSLEAVRLNDRSQPYEYGEKRRLDEATPGVGQRWSTPFEISRDAIRAYAESVFGNPGVQSKKQLDALTPPAQKQEKHTTHPEGDSR